MRSGNFGLLVLGTVVSLASAMAVLALDHAGIVSLGPATEERGPAEEQARAPTPASMSARIAAVPTPAPADRFAFVGGDAVALLSPPPADEPPLPEAVVPDITGPWLAEIQPELTPPSEEQRAADEPSQSPPWQSQVPRLPSQSPALTKRLAEISPAANARLAQKFEAAEAGWPPSDIALVAIKDEKALELYARPEGGAWTFIHSYPVLAASGGSGPKLRQGDKQVPEGVYGISFLNPNSRYHVSLRVNYPNAFDRRMASAEGRRNLGGDIMIHGKAVSVGCLAVGDAAAEELFVLAAHVGLANIKLIIAPTDFRRRGVQAVGAHQPKWLPDLYTEVAAAMSEFKAPPRVGLLSLFGI